MEKLLKKEFCVRGYHVYWWEVVVGEELECQQERGNATDAFAVSVIREGAIVGHLPRRISCTCSLFMRKGIIVDKINFHVFNFRHYRSPTIYFFNDENLPIYGIKI